jgi:hypothetical protein
MVDWNICTIWQLEQPSLFTIMISLKKIIQGFSNLTVRYAGKQSEHLKVKFSLLSFQEINCKLFQFFIINTKKLFYFCFYYNSMKRT